MRWVLLYGVLLIAATLKVASMPNPTPDAYFYSYLARGQDLATFNQTPGLPAGWIAIPEQVIAFRRPVFEVKPLYVALTRLAIPLVGVLRGPFVVSSAAYFCLGWGIWAWLRSLKVETMWRTLAAALMMSSSVFTGTARYGTPDLLCTLLLVSGAWLLVSTEWRNLGALVLTLAVFARIDSLVLAGSLLCWALWQRRVSLRVFGAWSAVMLVSEYMITRLGTSYGQIVSAALRTTYWHALTHNFAKTDVAICAPFVLLGLIAIKLRYQGGLVLVCLLSWVIRYVLLPSPEVRYMLPQVAILATIGVGATLGGTARAAPPTLEPAHPA